MLTMDKIHDIRFRFFVKGENISQIADVLQLDWKTVQKYIDKTDFNEPAPQQASDSVSVQSWIPTRRLLTNGLKRTNRHHVNSVIPPRGYSTVSERNSEDLTVHTGRSLPTMS